jgi:hypothetical protein
MLAFCALILLIYALLALATGVIFVPFGRRSAFLVGFPALLIALSAVSLACAAVIKIADHYDRRENATAYKESVTHCLKAAMSLFAAGATWGILEGLLSLFGARVEPLNFGFAANFSLYSSDLVVRFGRFIAPVVQNTAAIALGSIGIGIIGSMFAQSRSDALRRVSSLAIGVALIGGATLALAHSADELLSGELTIGSGRWEQLIDAEDEPARFNAVFLTQVYFGGLFWLVGVAMLIAAISTRSKRTR